MKVVSTNTGRIKEVNWRNRKITTGIFKEPVEGPLHLSFKGVKTDAVADLKVHGGTDKACYLYSSDHYPWWKECYPELDWTWGMFGENLTVKGLDEGEIMIGDTYKMGSAVVQVSQPRLPCYKLGIRLQSPGAVKKFLESPFPGVYLRILEEGKVRKGDSVTLVEHAGQGITVREVFSLFTSNRSNRELISVALAEEFLAESIKKDLRR